MGKVLVVDDHPAVLDSLGASLGRARIDPLCADSGATALEMIGRHEPDAIVCDLNMPRMDGLELLRHIRLYDPHLPVILVTGHATVESVIGALRQGAFDYLLKPLDGDAFVRVVRRALRHRRLLRDESHGVGESPVPPRLVGNSTALRRVRAQIQRIAPSQGTVLITGESGTGKEIVAQMIHAASPRRDAPLLCVNCAALSTSLLESELFGHEKGAFTGADQQRKGRFETAHGGTLLLDEVSEVSPTIQAKLLRVLQERQFERVGSSTTRHIDVRIIASTNRDLLSEVERGAFRRDLYYRLNVLPIHLPPLRDRREDVADIAAYFLSQHDDGGTPRQFTGDAIDAMIGHRWPGNVRELENICERAAVLATECDIDADLIAPWLAGPTPAASEDAAQTLGATDAAIASIAAAEGDVKTIEQLEREAIIRALARFNGHRQRTADALGIGVRTLGLKLKKWKEQRLVASTL